MLVAVVRSEQTASSADASDTRLAPRFCLGECCEQKCARCIRHCRPSEKVNWQREAEELREVLRSGSSLRTPILVGSASLSEGLLMGAPGWRCGLSWEITDLKKEAGLGLVGGSFAIVIYNVIIQVYINKYNIYCFYCSNERETVGNGASNDRVEGLLE
jgi:hypothetical protein